MEQHRAEIDRYIANLDSKAICNLCVSISGLSEKERAEIKGYILERIESIRDVDDDSSEMYNIFYSDHMDDMVDVGSEAAWEGADRLNAFFESPEFMLLLPKDRDEIKDDLLRQIRESETFSI